MYYMIKPNDSFIMLKSTLVVSKFSVANILKDYLSCAVFFWIKSLSQLNISGQNI